MMLLKFDVDFVTRFGDAMWCDSCFDSVSANKDV